MPPPTTFIFLYSVFVKGIFNLAANFASMNVLVLPVSARAMAWDFATWISKEIVAHLVVPHRLMLRCSRNYMHH